MQESPHPVSPVGVGIDLAERKTFSHLDRRAIQRAADRWLHPAERAWCHAQPSFREAVVIVLSCKEALYKAWDGSGQCHQLALAMYGREGAGWAVRVDPCPSRAVAVWGVSGESILAVAVAEDAGFGARGGHFCRTAATPCPAVPGHGPGMAVPSLAD